jgi:hypothetical protein
MVEIKTNLSKLIRAEEKGGVDYLVSPVILITEGVHNNILYPASELKKFPDAWSGRPLPLHHPMSGDKPVSANSPDVIEEQVVGQLFNVRYEDANDRHPARLIGEAWIDTAKLNKLADSGYEPARILLQELDDEKTIEVSTGLFTEDEMNGGKYNGEEYVAIARNYRPDHLSLLPAGIGACSAADGCGMPRINTALKVKETISKLLTRICGGRPKANELSARDMKLALDNMLRRDINLSQGEYFEITDLSESFVVYEVWNEGTGERKMLKRNIRVDDSDRIELSDSAVSVTRKTEYIPTNNSQIEKPTKEDEMEAKVDKLIAADNNWTAEDKATLMKMNEAAIDGFLGAEAPKANCQCQEQAPAPAPAVNTEEAAEKPLTKEDVAAIVTKSLTEAVPGLVANAVKARVSEDEKSILVNRLKANGSCKIQEDVLATMSVDALKGLEDSLQPAYFNGRGGVRNNAQGGKEEQAVMPVLFDASKN